ncbi:MAG TPA: GNAT family N-acetyltransferase [Candidatus Cloacimonadota bacterium]|nr:GNAT family N-acetyltransferase [Candidatus Cloacimonadota bacterium]
MKEIIIRTASRSDLDFMVEQAAQEGWNPGLHDADTFYQADPNGYFIAELDGETIGCISLVKYDETFAFLGFYIVLQPFRGQGIGHQIWQHAIEYAGNCNIGLDGVIAQQESYKQSGFQLAYSNIRYEYEKQQDFKPASAAVPLSSVCLEEILFYDRKCFPTERKTFLQNWMRQPGSQAFGVREGKNLAGFVVIRPCRIGYKIGPLFADSLPLAEALFQKAVSTVPAGAKIYLDIPELNPQAVQLVRKYGMKKVFETARMYTQNFPEIDLNRIFGVTTFELG